MSSSVRGSEQCVCVPRRHLPLFLPCTTSLHTATINSFIHADASCRRRAKGERKLTESRTCWRVSQKMKQTNTHTHTHAANGRTNERTNERTNVVCFEVSMYRDISPGLQMLALAGFVLRLLACCCVRLPACVPVVVFEQQLCPSCCPCLFACLREDFKRKSVCNFYCEKKKKMSVNVNVDVLPADLFRGAGIKAGL